MKVRNGVRSLFLTLLKSGREMVPGPVSDARDVFREAVDGQGSEVASGESVPGGRQRVLTDQPLMFGESVELDRLGGTVHRLRTGR